MAGKAGNWKKEIGWEQIDAWYYKAGGWTQQGGNITIEEIRSRCIEICGSAPSKGTLSPRYNKEGRERIVERSREYKKGFFGRFGAKLDRFKHEKPNIPQDSALYVNFYQAFRIKLKDNFRRGITKMKNISEETRNLTAHDYINFLVENMGLIYDKLSGVGEIPCNVCGEPVYCFGDNGHDWHLDHIIPITKGGTPDLDNLAIVHSNCNMGKGSMLMKDFLDLCRQITNYHSSK